MSDISINPVTRRVQYTGNTGLGPFAFTFNILTNTDIVAYKNSTLLTLTTDYTVTINANGTGSITLTGSGNGTALVSADILTIIGGRELSRTTDFVTAGDLLASSLNEQLDSQVIMVQQLDEQAKRTMRVSPDDVYNDMTLPLKTSRAGKTLAFDSNGDPTVGEDIGNWRGNWAAGTIYTVRDLVKDPVNLNIYRVNTAHTSSGSAPISSNADSAKWDLVIDAASAADAEAAQIAAEAAQAAAEAAQSAAETAETNAAASESAAATSESNAASSESAAALSASAASTSETNAASSASAASTSASNAVTSANAASTSASNAAGSATSAAGSATSAGSSAYAAGIEASTALSRATAAANSATAAATSATNAAASEAGVAADAATATTKAAEAATSETNAAASASAAATSASNAATSATNASASAAAANAVSLGNEPIRHSVRPSLLLDFANTKQLDPRITFSRSSTATYYDGKTVAKAEENLLTNSQNIANGTGYWSSSGSTITANSATAPDGTSTASTVVTTGAGGVRFNFSLAAGTYTVSVFVRSVSGDTSFQTDFQNGNVGSLTLTSSWQRHVSTQTTSATKSWLDFQINGAGTFEIWGAQLEQRDTVTAYTATTSQPITNYIPVLKTAAGGQARFDHNPTTGESLGLLIEEQRTNLALRSYQFDNATWTKSNATVTANTVIAPDGTLEADKLVGNTSNAQHYVRQTISISSSTNYSYSFYAKAGEYTLLGVRETGLMGSGDGVTVNLLTNEVTGSGVTVADAGNGWKRITFVRTSGAAQGQWQLDILLNNGSTTTFASDGYSGIFLWGAQLEAGSFATSYIPTTTAQVTRSADAASMTGTNFSSWYRADEGSFYAEAYSPSGIDVYGNSYHLFSVSDTGLGNRIRMARTALKEFLAEERTGGSIYVNISAGSLSDNTLAKAAFGLSVNNFVFVKDGTVVGTDTSGQMPRSVDKFDIGTLASISNTQWNSTIKKLAYYPARLTNAELQGLTS